MFPTTYVQFVLSYLHNRTFNVRIIDKHSTCKQINAGVPQGSKLGPWLYKIYIHDIPIYPHTLLAIYADDTAIKASIKTFTCRHTFLVLRNFFNKWIIKINTNKSQAVFFSKKHSFPAPLDFNNSPVDFGRKVKYLITILDSNLPVGETAQHGSELCSLF